jgi:hypothetical protein
MRSTEFDRAHKGIVYRDLRLFMNLSFNSFEFSHVPRTCNKLAHELAAYGATHGWTLNFYGRSCCRMMYLFGWTAYLLIQLVNGIMCSFLKKKMHKSYPHGNI